MGNFVPKKILPVFPKKPKLKGKSSGSTSPQSDASTATCPSPRVGRSDDRPPKSPRSSPRSGSSPATPDDKFLRSSVSSDDESIPARIFRVAKAIAEADLLLLFIGSGFQSDSGLPLCKELSEVPQYRSRGLSYASLSDPGWLDNDLSLFYGFWGTCFNDFRWSKPHDGYRILKLWRDHLFQGTATSEGIKQRLRAQPPEGSDPAETALEPDPYRCRNQAGAFFVFTSNVGGHALDFFDPSEVRECHGNVELWQCSNVCWKRVWRAPQDYIFRVDLRNMLASDPPGTNMERGVSELLAKPHEAEPKDERKVGKRRRDGVRYGWLQNIPPPSEDRVAMRVEGFGRANRPVCPNCKMPARPNVLMSSDLGWIDNSTQEKRWTAWLQAVKEESLSRRKGHSLKAVVLEIGAGSSTFPTVRSTSQTVAGRLEQTGATVTMVRINPNNSTPDGVKGSRLKRFISLPLKGLEAVQAINYEVQAAMRRRHASESSAAKKRGTNI